MSIILKPFALLLGFLYSITGSYGLAIILFSLIFKIILFPVSIRGRRSTLDMSRLSERQKELQEKYGKDRTRYSVELQKLYTAENVKPSGGCLWMLIPMPVLMILFFIISQPFTNLMGLSGDEASSLMKLFTDASRPSQLSVVQQVYDNFGTVQSSLPEVAAQIQSAGGPISFNFFGLNLSSTPDFLFFQKEGAFTWGNIGLFLIPVVAAVLGLLSALVNMKINKHLLGTVTKQDKTNRQMLIIQPAISLWLGFTLPAALGLYWAANSLFAILQEFFSIGILRKYLAKRKEEAEQRKLEQKEKEKVQKKILAEQKKQKAEEAKRIKMERKLSSGGISESRVGIRAYAKGRTYDPDRYPTTPYHDPDDILKEQKAAVEQQKENKEKKKKKKKPNHQVEPVIEQRDPQETMEVLEAEEAVEEKPVNEEAVPEVSEDEKEN